MKVLLISLLLTAFASADFPAESADKRALLCRSWRPDKYQEANGQSFPVPPEARRELITYFADHTMTSWEAGIKIRGRWQLDEQTMVLTTTQTQTTAFPARIRAKVKQLTASALVMEAADAGGEKLTVYFKPAQ